MLRIWSGTQAIFLKVLNGAFEKRLCSQSSCQLYFSKPVVRSSISSMNMGTEKNPEVNKM